MGRRGRSRYTGPMNELARRIVGGVLLLAAGIPPGARAQFHEEPDPTDIALSGKTAESIIIAWPTYSYRLARLMIEEYGQPAMLSDDSLVWLDAGPWRRTVVYRESKPGDSTPPRHPGRLEQSVAYRVPPEQADALRSFDPLIEADANANLLSYRSDLESENILTLNLADDVIGGRSKPEEAANRRRELLKLSQAGKSSPYLERLLFVQPVKNLDPESPD